MIAQWQSCRPDTVSERFGALAAWQACVIAALRGERAGDIPIDGQIASMDGRKGPARMICAGHVVIPSRLFVLPAGRSYDIRQPLARGI